jgi:hypothetical protein
MRDCPSMRVLVVRDDGENSSASDFDEDTLALLVDDQEGNDDHPKEHVGTGDEDHYESLIVQRVLSRSCNNLASSDMVDKLALTTKPHPRPYHIQMAQQ